MRGPVIKTELLWSRACPLACEGCAMPNTLRMDNYYTTHEGSPAQWATGMERLRAWGCEFVAIYGAEPITRMVGLPEVINSIYSTGMKATLITAYPDKAGVARVLAESQLDSITMSYDVVQEHEGDRALKQLNTRRALDAAHLANLPDVAVVVTVTADNVASLPDVARTMSARGVWTLFDLLHRSGGPASKCGHEGIVEPPPAAAMQKAAAELQRLKAEGLLIHASNSYLQLLQTAYDGEPRHLWHCAGKAVGWLTVDADGVFLACDDWQVRSPWRVWDAVSWPEVEAWIAAPRASCIGCAWNTHWDAVAIAEGEFNDSYVHVPSVSS